MQTTKAACVQASPVYMNLDGCIDKASVLITEAASNGADIIAFPETWIPGYPWFVWLGAPAWSLQFIPPYHENSMAVDSPQMRKLCEVANENNIHVCFGFSEKAAGSRYMSQALLSNEGEILFVRRKLKPTFVERTVFGEGDGSDFQVVDTSLGKVGALNCWEHLQPLSRMVMYSMHEEIHVAGWPSFCCYRDIAYALGPEVNIDGASKMYAVEGSCYVLASVAVTGQDCFDMLCDTEDKAALLNPRTSKPGGGHSMIFAPDGRALVEPLADDEEGILYADLDPHVITIAKTAADPVGHYGRPDVVSLVWDRSKRSVVKEAETDPHRVALENKSPGRED